jgi:hypothetical protein
MNAVEARDFFEEDEDPAVVLATFDAAVKSVTGEAR